MKRNAMIFPLIIFFIFAMMQKDVIAVQNEPDGFRGIKWGTGIKDVDGMTVLPDKLGENEKAYQKKDDTLKMGNANMEAIKYIFYKGKFYMARIDYGKNKNYLELKKFLEEQFGGGTKPNVNYEQYVWEWNSSTLLIYYSKKTDQGHIVYYNKPIRDEKKKDEKEKEKKLEMKRHMGD
jgi:hypothetical protein